MIFLYQIQSCKFEYDLPTLIYKSQAYDFDRDRVMVISHFALVVPSTQTLAMQRPNNYFGDSHGSHIFSSLVLQDITPSPPHFFPLKPSLRRTNRATRHWYSHHAMAQPVHMFFLNMDILHCVHPFSHRTFGWRHVGYCLLLFSFSLPSTWVLPALFPLMS